MSAERETLLDVVFVFEILGGVLEGEDDDDHDDHDHEDEEEDIGAIDNDSGDDYDNNHVVTHGGLYVVCLPYWESKAPLAI